MPDLTESMKKAALQAMDATKPVNVAFGTVVQENPLMICVEQKMTLGMEQLVLSRNVTDHDIDVSVKWATNNSGTEVHLHGVSGTKSMHVHLGLTLGEHVVLLRLQGGQQYLVWDRVV